VLLAHNGFVFAGEEVPDDAGGYRLAVTVEHLLAGLVVMPVAILAADARDETALFR
jgi:hypothetical protein